MAWAFELQSSWPTLGPPVVTWPWGDLPEEQMDECSGQAMRA